MKMSSVEFRCIAEPEHGNRCFLCMEGRVHWGQPDSEIQRGFPLYLPISCEWAFSFAAVAQRIEYRSSKPAVACSSQAGSAIFSGCSAVGSVRHLGCRGRPFEPDHPDCAAVTQRLEFRPYKPAAACSNQAGSTIHPDVVRREHAASGIPGPSVRTGPSGP